MSPMSLRLTSVFAAGIEYLTGTTVTGVDIKGKSVSTDKGQKFSYDKLMIATGSTVGNLDLLDTKCPTQIAWLKLCAHLSPVACRISHSTLLELRMPSSTAYFTSVTLLMATS